MAMRHSTGIERLPLDARLIVTELLKHRAVRRLGGIRQLGFSQFHQQTRLRHTLESVNFAIRFLERAGVTSAAVRNHLLSAIVLEDVGRAPFSHSLDAVFADVPGLSGAHPIDIGRSIVVITYLEDSEKLLTRHSLSP